jgi:hypothetical protein
MPSPISEDEADAQMVRLGRLSVSQQVGEMEGVEGSGGMYGLNGMIVEEDDADGENSAGPVSRPAMKGRKRSGALTGMPGRFTMGYREDCEKCRARVAGHYSHFL